MAGGVGTTLAGIVAKTSQLPLSLRRPPQMGGPCRNRARERDTSKATTPAAGAAGVQVATPIVAYAGTQVALALSYL
jgi:hypothetical protein